LFVSSAFFIGVPLISIAPFGRIAANIGDRFASSYRQTQTRGQQKQLQQQNELSRFCSASGFFWSLAQNTQEVIGKNAQKL
jgi:hypothetical protein